MNALPAVGWCAVVLLFLIIGSNCMCSQYALILYQ